jgi:pimeloyl-ACP methyl ester carboxylesterase
VYQTPSGLAPLTDEGRGEVVRCAPDVALDMAAVQKELMGKNLNDVTATTGLNLVRIAYRTRRAAGVDGVSTARVYLPTTPRPAPLPVIVIAHPSDGLADNCAPSKDAASLQDLALPWAARGYAVIATDYAGLGNEGTQGYLDNHDQAYSVLDSARALRRLLPAGWLSTKAVIAGHSQGGGAALSAQALAASYGLDADLTAVTVFAPEWPSRLNSFGFVNVLRNPDTLTILSGITKPVVIPSLVYAYGRNHAPDALASLFPPGKESGLGTAEESMCLQQFGAYIQSVAVHQRDLVSDELRTSFLACVDGKPGCAEPGKGLYEYMSANLLTPDPAGAPVLYSQGLLDTIMPPNEEAACNLARLETAGVDTTVCTDKTGIHTNIVVDSIVFSMKWAEAALGDLARPTCDGGGMPACLP